MSIHSAATLEKPKQRVNIFFAGMALFSMFFGAGNIVFPLLLGQMSGTKVPFAIVGLSLSAVAFPFLGLIAMMLYGGDLLIFLRRLGKWPSFALLLILQLAQGPMGCLPRLVTLMHASVKLYFPEISLFVFSIFICVILFLLTFRPQKIVDLLGAILTPFLLLALGILIVFGAINAPEAPVMFEGAQHYLVEGIKGGYQTMDLIGSLLFATVMLPHLSRDLTSLPEEETKKILRRRMTWASGIAASLLILTYIGLCWISAHHATALDPSIAPETLLQAIAIKILGSQGGAVAAIVVFLACLTTAISLSLIFSEYVRKNLCFETISPAAALSATLLITGAIANLGFSGIIQFIGPVLSVLYPALIVLCLLNIAHALYRVQTLQAPVFFTLGFAIGGVLGGI
jgi:LIVCS family branched-chain amino acid:cation transporter